MHVVHPRRGLHAHEHAPLERDEEIAALRTRLAAARPSPRPHATADEESARETPPEEPQDGGPGEAEAAGEPDDDGG